MKLEITASLPTTSAAALRDFAPVEGSWSISDASCMDIIHSVAAEEASRIVDGEVSPADFKVELFRYDGRSLDGADGITSGSLLVTRR